MRNTLTVRQKLLEAKTALPTPYPETRHVLGPDNDPTKDRRHSNQQCAKPLRSGAIPKDCHEALAQEGKCAQTKRHEEPVKKAEQFQYVCQCRRGVREVCKRDAHNRGHLQFRSLRRESHSEIPGLIYEKTTKCISDVGQLKTRTTES